MSIFKIGSHHTIGGPDDDYILSLVETEEDNWVRLALINTQTGVSYSGSIIMSWDDYLVLEATGDMSFQDIRDLWNLGEINE